jgi:gliding motility-associated-like protein
MCNFFLSLIVLNFTILNSRVLKSLFYTTTLFLIFFGGVHGQITMNPPLTPAQYVQNIVGPGIAVSNVTFTGNTSQIGAFSGTSNIGYSSGVVLSSGSVSELVGPASSSTAGTANVSGLSDPDLLNIASTTAQSLGIGTITSTSDLVALEFDFVAESNVVSFNFVFGSDEYLTYVNTSFNDIFGFFVSGPGISGPYAAPAGFPNGAANLAVVPGTNTPITISTIHPNLNSQYFINNQGGTTHTLNGITTQIPVTFNVICGETYHFKFAVADCQDNFLSTAVFLQDDSFTSPPVDLTLQTANGTDTIPEACIGAEVLFIRSDCQSSDSLAVNFSVSGTAIDSVDYDLADSPIIMVPGQDTAAISITPIVDNIPEGTESITVSISFLNSAGDTVVVSGTVYLTDIQPVVINESDLQLQCYNDSIELTAIASGGSGAFTYNWAASNSDSITDYVSVLENGTFNYVISVTDECLGTFSDTATVIMNQTIAIDTMYSFPSTCVPTGAVSGVALGTIGVANYNWTGPGPNNSNFINASVWEDLSPGWYYFTVTDNVCSVNDSVYVDILNPPIAQFSVNPLSGCDPLLVTITNESQNSDTYIWSFGDGENATITDIAPFDHIYSDPTSSPQSYLIQLIVSQGQNCSDTTTNLVTSNICGCTDPEATNYNSIATVDDGSCILPNPDIQAPNIFTPNDDGANDVFFLTSNNLKTLRLVIINRWGNEIFDKSTEDVILNNPTWNGDKAEEGVYFYRYEATGFTGNELTGHGFIHLVRTEN